MTSPSQLPDQDFELLNAYLDNQLSPSARVALEHRLAAELPLRAALNDLRQTIQTLKAAPQVATPRNFTLDPVRYGRRVPWWARSGAMQLIGAMGAAASVILIVLGLVFSTVQTASSSVSAPRQSSQNAVAVLPTDTGSPMPNALNNPVTVVPGTATSAPVTPKVLDNNKTASTTPAPTLILAIPSVTAHTEPTTLQAFSAATPIPTETAITSNAAAPAGPVAPRPNSSSLLPQSGGAGGSPNAQGNAQSNAQSSGAVAPRNVPPPQTDQLSAGAQPTTARDMTQTAQQAKANVLQAATGTSAQKDQTTEGIPQSAASADEGAALAATSVSIPTATIEAASPTPIASTTTTFTPTPEPTVAARLAAVPTAFDKGIGRDYAAQQASPQVPILLVAGIALLVFSVMLFLLGWLRSRLSRQDR